MTTHHEVPDIMRETDRRGRPAPGLFAARIVAACVLAGTVATIELRAQEAPRAADAGDPAAAAEERLFERLARFVRDGEAPPLTVSFGEDLEYEIRGVDGVTLVLELRGASTVKAPPLHWPWPQIPIGRRVGLLDRLPLDAALRCDLGRLCFASGMGDEAHAQLHRVITDDGSESARARVNRILADISGTEASFEWFEGRFVLPAEKRRILIRNAEAWLMARQAAEDERYERTDSIFQKAHWLQTKGFFEMARGMFRKVARLDPETDIGRESSEKVADNTYLLRQPIVETGPTENRVDVVILGDGYQLDDRHQGSFRRACDQLVDYLLEREVIAEYASYFNFHRVHTSSRESGVDNHTQDFSTALGGKWSGASQGQVTVDHGLVRRMLARHEVPWDNAMVMVKRGGLGTGGSRISAFAHASTGTAYHEFGHSFAGLLDEYNTQVSDTPNLGGAPRGWNIANSPDVDQCPWKHWIEAKTDGVGLFVGGAAGAPGAFRPTASGCLMNSSDEFCVVCREQVVRTIYRFVRPIEKVEPAPGVLEVTKGGEMTFRIEVLKPTTHLLDVAWTFNGRPAPGKRQRKVEESRVIETFRVAYDELKIARGYRGVITVTVRDTTDWVLLDEDKLLEQRLSWTLDYPEIDESRTTPGARPRSTEPPAKKGTPAKNGPPAKNGTPAKKGGETAGGGGGR